MRAPKSMPLAEELLLALAREHGTPLFVYDAATRAETSMAPSRKRMSLSKNALFSSV